MIGILFWGLTSIACLYAAALGGRDGRLAAAMLLVASILSVPAILMGREWSATETGLLLVDGGLLVCLFVLALLSPRFFPIWMAGFQLVSVTAHLATLLAPDFAPRIYQALEQVWAIPITLAMVVGVSMDRRVRMATP